MMNVGDRARHRERRRWMDRLSRDRNAQDLFKGQPLSLIRHQWDLEINGEPATRIPKDPSTNQGCITIFFSVRLAEYIFCLNDS